jgi:hypothetical protein
MLTFKTLSLPYSRIFIKNSSRFWVDTLVLGGGTVGEKVSADHENYIYFFGYHPLLVLF